MQIKRVAIASERIAQEKAQGEATLANLNQERIALAILKQPLNQKVWL